MSRKFWTDHEVATLRALYPTTRAKHIAEQLPGRSVRQILSKAYNLGIRRDVEVIRAHASEAMRDPAHGGRRTQFHAGQRSWNSGLKGWHSGGRSAETQFKKGQRPYTWKPVGTERINSEGYLQRKVTDTGYPPRDWVGVHTLLWIEANGPLPAGHFVVFKDGNRRNFALDNLDAVTRQENMRRNTVHHLPKPIAQLVQLRGALKRKINRLTKESHEQPTNQ